jgi:hypothetical protein
MSTFKNDTAIYRPDLGTSVMEFYDELPTGLIGLEVMPIFRTALQSSSYPVVPKEALLKISNVDRAPRASYSRDDYQMERGYFSTAEKGREELLDDVERRLLDQEDPGLAEEVATRRAYTAIMRAQEKRIADIFDNATNFATNNVSSVWSAYSTADPVSDVLDAKEAFKLQCGVYPTAMVMTETVRNHVVRCSAVKDLIKYTFPGIDIANMNDGQLAQLFGIPRVIKANAVYDSAGKGLDASIGDIWSSAKVWLVKTNASQDLSDPCVGRTFLWTADSPTNPIVEQYRSNENRSDVFRVRHHVGEELIASRNDSGTIVSNVSAACCYVLSNITS